MSFPRLTLVILPLALGLPLLTGACGAPLAVTAASYGADGASMMGTGKSVTDHFVSMVSKKDCALWRMFRNENVCHPFDGSQNPYDVDYNAPFRQEGEDGVEYLPPLHAAADAPATSWDASAYDATPPSAVAASQNAGSVQAEASVTEAASVPAVAAPAPVKVKHPKRHPAGHSVIRHKPPKKKPVRDRAETAP